MKKTLKANAGAYLAMAKQAKEVAPETVNALDRKIARRLDGPKYSDEKLFAERGALITMSDGYQFKKVSKTFAKKNWNKIEIFGINKYEDFEGVIDEEDEIENYDDFGVEIDTKMSGGGKTDRNWIKMSAEDLKEQNAFGDDFEITDIWYNTQGDAEFYRIEQEKGEKGATVLGELGDMGETLIEDYPTYAKAQARALELVRIAQADRGFYGNKMSGGGEVKDIEEIVIKGIIKNWKKLGYDNLTAIKLAEEDIADSTLSRTNDKTIVQISKAFTDYSGKRVIQKTIWNITPKGVVIDGQYTQRILKGDKSIWTKQNYNYAEGGKITEINEDGSNLPKPLYELFGELNEDGDPYKEMERLKLKANELGYDFDYDLSGGPTEFWKIDKMSGGGKLERYDDMSDEEIIEWANENDLGYIAEKDIDGKIKNREEVLVTILELNVPNTDSEGNFLTEQFDDTYAYYDKGGKILKQSHLSSAEYQKAKKLKNFNDKNYKWNPASQLYDKTIKKMNGGYIESMGAGFDSAINELVIAFDKWKDGPMTEPEDVELAKSDILEYIESRLIVVPTINIYSLNPAGTLKTSQSVVSKLAKSRNIIKSFVEEPQSGAWMMTLKGYSGFVIYCTPFWEDFDGLNIAIMDSETGEELYSEEIEMPGTMSSIKTYQELYVFFATKYMPEILEQVKQLKSNMFSELTDNEVGNYYDIVDTGMNEWTYDWEYVGSTDSDEGKEWIDEAVNRDIDYFDKIYGDETFSWHVQDETNGDMVGDVREGTARQITKFINEELDNNQSAIFAGHDSIILIDDIYYKLPYNMSFRGVKEMKNYKLNRAERTNYVMEGIFNDISDYGGELEEEKYIFASTQQFDDSTQIFDAKELKIYFRDDLIRTSIEWDERSARGLTKDKLQEFMGTADDILIKMMNYEFMEVLLYNGTNGNDDNAKLWTADYVIGRNVLNETDVKVHYEDIEAVEITSKQRQMNKGGGINSKYKKPSKSYTNAKVKKYINDNSRKFFDGGEITLADDYNWAEEVKYFAGDDYDKLTEQEKETIMSELKLNYEFHQSYKEGGKTGKMSKKYKKGDVVSCGKKGGTIQKVAGDYAQIKFDSGATDYVSFSKITD